MHLKSRRSAPNTGFIARLPGCFGRSPELGTSDGDETVRRPILGTASMKKWISIGLLFAAIVLTVFVVRFFTVTPGWIDQSQNRVVPVPLDITAAAQQLHATVDAADMHAD